MPHKTLPSAGELLSHYKRSKLCCHRKYTCPKPLSTQPGYLSGLRDSYIPSHAEQENQLGRALLTLPSATWLIQTLKDRKVGISSLSRLCSTCKSASPRKLPGKDGGKAVLKHSASQGTAETLRDRFSFWTSIEGRGE